MKLPGQIATHLREVHFGENWTSSNLRDHLADVTWEEATTTIYSLNTIVALVFHINYYISAVMKLLEGEPLHAKDEYSFDHPPVLSAEDWEKLLSKTWEDAEKFADLIEVFPEEKLWDILVEEKYGTYYRNFHGIIEHAHYHLGQIVLIKKIMRESRRTQTI